ncbi:formylglycine-generating enzyme family protein [Rhizobium fabae]|uniref:Formylglycine-generating enzyme family protein n=2 Tax=Rhizobium fabae TaxID=573179 RepID=A0ABY0B2M8_9HYPH|nr:SUMF1/EgtB/PvdO family nonheme iron enzyme [Rhizobium fabae]RUM09089.1 formylglycine-generating enzyme family protein [Rhizobium fabae]
MIPVCSGTIVMRDDRLRESWTVAIKPFLICRYQVTQSFYAKVMGVSPSSIAAEDQPVETVSWLHAARFCNRLSAMVKLPDRYVFSSDGQDATAVATSDGFRLPSEAEWEFACRAGTKGPRYGPIADIAWYGENSEGGSKAVGTKRPNDWGLHDMLGNVWEWCEDVYDPAVYGTYRIFRGGGWADHERGCLATNRRRSHPTFAIDDLGFRIARSCFWS